MSGKTLYILKPFWLPNLRKFDEKERSLGDRSRVRLRMDKWWILYRLCITLFEAHFGAQREQVLES